MRSQRFEKAYNALVTAYFDGTLAKCDCKACAVGNMVAFAQGGTVRKRDNDCLHDCDVDNHSWFTRHEYDGDMLKTIEPTGYSIYELREIERAFEGNTHIIVNEYKYTNEQEILEDQFNGLCAVVDVLLSFEENQEVGTLKTKFREHPKLQLA